MISLGNAPGDGWTFRRAPAVMTNGRESWPQFRGCREVSRKSERPQGLQSRGPLKIQGCFATPSW